MANRKKLFLIAFALFAVALNIYLYTWNQSQKALEVPYLVNIPVDRVAFDKQGRVWVSGSGKLSIYQDGALIQVFTEKDSPALVYPTWLLKIDNQERAWIDSWNSESNKSELAVFDSAKLLDISSIPEPVLKLILDSGITAIDFDAEGRAWIGTDTQGVYVLDGENWENYTSRNSGLLGDTVTCISFDNQERAWIGTWGETTRVGLTIFDGKNWQAFTAKDSPQFDLRIDAIAFDLQGRAWVASKGIYIFDGENWTRVSGNDDSFLEIEVDSQGRIWAMKAFDEGIVVFDGKTQKYYFDPFHLSVGQFGGMLATDKDGNIWIPTENGVVIIPPDSPQPISYTAGIASIVITTNGLIYLTALLTIVWLCVALNMWRSLGFSLLGFPIYLGWIILNNQGLSQFNFSQFNTYFFINPGIIGTIAGIIGGCLDIFFAKSGSAKRTRWGLVGLVIGSGLSFCFMIVANMAQ